MDDLALFGEGIQASGDPVVEAHAHGDEHIAGLDGPVGEGLAVHPAHAQAQRVAFGDVARAQEGGDHGNLGFFHQLEQFAGNAGDLDAVAAQDQRALGLVDQLCREADALHVHGGPGFEAGQLHFHVVTEEAGGILYVFADVDEDDAGAAAAGDIEGFLDDTGQFVDVGDQVVVFADRGGDAHHICFLESVCTQQVGGHLAGEGDDGHAVHLGCGQAGDQVGGAWPAGGDTDADLARGPGEAVGHVGGALFVAHQHVVDAPVGLVGGQCIVGGQDRAARMAEDQMHILAEERLPHHLRPLHGHRCFRRLVGLSVCFAH